MDSKKIISSELELPANQTHYLESHGMLANFNVNNHSIFDDMDTASTNSIFVTSNVIRGESQNNMNYSDGSKKSKSKILVNHASLVFPFVALEDIEPVTVFTDYFTVTFPFCGSDMAIQSLKSDVCSHLGKEFTKFNSRRKGFHGYQTSFDIGKTGAFFAFGGQSGTAIISLPATACALIENWHQCNRLFNTKLKGRITRWDVAADVYDGRPSVDDAVNFYQAGLFNCGGMKPSCTQHGNWIDPDNSGRTFCVGKRKNGKYLRVYEKGKQLGDPNSPWVRWELELHNKDRDIPWDVILQPGKYLAGSYPCLGWTSDARKGIKTKQKTAQIKYESSVRHLRHNYGKLINLMLEVEGSPENVIQLLIRNGLPKKLDYGENLLSLLVSLFKKKIRNNHSL